MGLGLAVAVVVSPLPFAFPKMPRETIGEAEATLLLCLERMTPPHMQCSLLVHLAVVPSIPKTVTSS